MRIRTFCKNIEANELEECNLKNCNVVIDGQNYFYNLYQESGLPFQFGCESDRYADYLRDHLSMYKKANVKCYIIFKGGHGEEKKRFKDKDKFLSGTSYDPLAPPDGIILPVFMKTVYKEVLDEMCIDYVMCEFESKQQCIALAQKLKCPIISYDIEFAFSGVPYIPYIPSLTYISSRRTIQCGIFKLDKFMKKYKVSKEHLSLFIVLTDEKMFPDLPFQPLLEREGISCLRPFKRNLELLDWLSRKTVDEIIRKALQILSPEDKQKFEEERIKMIDFIGRIEAPGEPMKYLMNGKSVSFEINDPCWFEKGVVTNNISPRYVNLYHSNSFFGSWCIEDFEADDALFLSIDLIKYAFNLLTNYQRDNIAFYNNKWEIQNVSLTNSATVQKPLYEALESPFENGWDGLKPLKLFDYFLNESLPDANLSYLTKLPKDARLLMLALVFFASRKGVDTTRETYCILISYVMLGAVFPKLTANNNDKFTKTNSDDNGSTKDLLNLSDCRKAISLLAPFSKLSRSELGEIFNRKFLHPFVEFQHCLEQMNILNNLCGQCSFEPTIYSKTYNGTFVYKLFYSIKNESSEKALQTIKKILTPAPTVLEFFMSLVNVYELAKSV